MQLSGRLRPIETEKTYKIHFMKTITILFCSSILFLGSCSSESSNGTENSDSLSAKDSLKKKITEDLPPSTDIKQFEWIYSSFVAASTYSTKDFNIFIHPEHGLWIIRTNGALPQMKRVTDIAPEKGVDGDSLIPFNREKMIATPIADALPEVNCDMPSFWSKNGCFTSETNTFKESRIWESAGLNDNDANKAKELADKITRVVVNTEMNMRFYFAEISGTWYLLFLDMRVPCSA